MGKLYNRKHNFCKLCGKKHAARGYCLKHYRNLMSGRQLEPNICKVCKKSRVFVHIKESVCSNCFPKFYRLLNPRYGMDGGKWGYKEHRKTRRYKKTNCEICVANKNLVVHHIDGNTRNSNISNLKTLCKKCHCIAHIKMGTKLGRPRKYIFPLTN